MAKETGRKMIAQNKKARHDYAIEDTYEAGIVLQGTEVKSLRAGRASLVDGFAEVENGEVFLHAIHIPTYTQGTWTNHEVRAAPQAAAATASRSTRSRRRSGRRGTRWSRWRCTSRTVAPRSRSGWQGRKSYDKRHAIAERTAKREAEIAVGRKFKGMG